MKDQDIVKAITELDGWLPPEHPEVKKFCNQAMDKANCWWRNPKGKFTVVNEQFHLPPYLTSRDAILSVIEKTFHFDNTKFKFETVLIDVLLKDKDVFVCTYFDILQATPHQLCEALLRATGKWID